jgi:hypothetical protein
MGVFRDSIQFPLNRLRRAFDSGGGSRRVVERRELPAFSSVRAGGRIELRVQKGAFELVVSCDERIMPDVETWVEGGALVIRQRFGLLSGIASLVGGRIMVEVSMPALEAIQLSGASSAELGGFEGHSLDARLSGSSRARVSGIASRELCARVSGSAELSLSGAAAQAQIVASGSSRVEGARLSALRAEARISGSSHVSLRAEELLSVSASGSSEVEFFGDPATSIGTSGSARVHRAGI